MEANLAQTPASAPAAKNPTELSGASINSHLSSEQKMNAFLTHNLEGFRTNDAANQTLSDPQFKDGLRTQFKIPRGEDFSIESAIDRRAESSDLRLIAKSKETGEILGQVNAQIRPTADGQSFEAHTTDLRTNEHRMARRELEATLEKPLSRNAERAADWYKVDVSSSTQRLVPNIEERLEITGLVPTEKRENKPHQFPILSGQSYQPTKDLGFSYTSNLQEVEARISKEKAEIAAKVAKAVGGNIKVEIDMSMLHPDLADDPHTRLNPHLKAIIRNQDNKVLGIGHLMPNTSGVQVNYDSLDLTGLRAAGTKIGK